MDHALPGTVSSDDETLWTEAQEIDATCRSRIRAPGSGGCRRFDENAVVSRIFANFIPPYEIPDNGIILINTEPTMKEEALRWYALKVFYNRTAALEKKITVCDVETYIPMQTLEKFDADGLHYEEKPLINSLLFVRCKESWLISFKRDNPLDFMFYTASDLRRPGPIDDEEMRMFMFVTSADRGRNLHYFGESDSTFKMGQKVRVIDGIYKGAEGYIKRIKKDRKLIVSVSGVAVVAVSHIPPEYLEKIEA